MFVLTIEVHSEARALSLRLSDEHGRHLGANEVRLDDHPVRAWEGVFDARGYVRRFAGIARRPGGGAPLSVAELEARIGAFLGRAVLGTSIMGALYAGITQRELVVRLPDPSKGALAGALARVPWEMARPARGDEPEGEPLVARNVVMRAALEGDEPASPGASGVAVPLAQDEPLRVLFVHAEAPESRPLDARREREALMSLFASEVMPTKRVVVEALCHGVTRERLRERVQSAGGYHVVHWSGHGEHDALEIAERPSAPGGAPSRGAITGAELVDVFARAGGFIPRLFFLSACQSGSFTDASEWAELQAALRDKSAPLCEPDAPEAPPPELSTIVADRRGRAGTALELYRAGASAVVAMRFEVGDAYARELAVRFYRCLFAQQRPHAVGSALAMARAELARESEAAAYHPVDHATAFCIGATSARFEPAAKRSPQLDRLRPRPQPLLRGRSRDLDPSPSFEGRGAELAELSLQWLAAGGAPLAWIEGEPGVGKTALAAEVIHLWHAEFDWVVALQARGAPPDVFDVYRQIDERLRRASPAYRERCAYDELSKIYLEPEAVSDEEGRADALLENLVSAMIAERILLVFDAIDSHAAWAVLLRALIERLAGAGSRVLVTCRSPFPGPPFPDRMACHLALRPRAPRRTAAAAG